MRFSILFKIGRDTTKFFKESLKGTLFVPLPKATTLHVQKGFHFYIIEENREHFFHETPHKVRGDNLLSVTRSR